jgi:phage terminase large subunit-like protein
LPRWSSPIRTSDGRLLPTHGPEICRWIEATCKFGEGDWVGQDVRLRTFQRLIFSRLNEFYPETGERRYRRALIGMAKGNGKTPVAAWAGAAALAGPFAAPSPHVAVGAASLKQANWVFGDLKAAVTGSKENPSPLRRFIEPYELQVLLRDGLGLAERIAAEAGTNDGARYTEFIGDELHEWRERLKRIYLIADGAVAKRRNGLSLGITTAFAQGSDSAAEDLYDYGKRVATGEIVDDRFLMMWWEADEELDLNDPDQWLTAVLQANPAVACEDPFNSLDSIHYRFETIPLYEWIRYHLNRPSQSEALWLPPGAWQKRASLDRAVPLQSDVFLAFAGTYDGDSASIMGCTPDGHEFVVASFEARGELGVDRDEVGAAVDAAMQRYRVRRLVCKPLGWHEEVARWARTYRNRVVEFDWTHQIKRRVDACSKFYSAVQAGGISHDGDARLDRHLASAEVHESKEGAYIAQGDRSASPITLAEAAVMAFDQLSVKSTAGKLVGGFTI